MNWTFPGLPLILPTFAVFALVVSSGAQDPQHPQPRSDRYVTPAAGSQTDQQNFPLQLLDELAEIKSAALADDYAYRELSHLTENIGPRPTGSLQAKAAAGDSRQALVHATRKCSSPARLP